MHYDPEGRADMNIAKAKEQIRKSASAYMAVSSSGSGYRMETEQMRPILLMGPPGIGKSAIVRQVAEELNIGFISYSMTHHTRQSALGLPHILTKEYGGMMTSVTEYTMSEIIASVYSLMEESGIRSGILFLDEINCVSETLRPVMLQFLQYKTFGKHELPPGWMIVSAGNPPEYNRSAREFDIVTLDRIRRIEIDPDLSAWLRYAQSTGIHPSIPPYLSAHPEDFYKVKTTAAGQEIVTARGWSDLSEMITVLEEQGESVERDLVIQYLQSRNTAEDFTAYYKLFNKYRSDYRIEDILAGQEPAEIHDRAAAAPFDERYALITMLIEYTTRELAAAVRLDEVCHRLHPVLKEIKTSCVDDNNKDDDRGLRNLLLTAAAEQEAVMTRARVMGTLGRREREIITKTAQFLRDAADGDVSDFEDVEGRYRSIIEERAAAIKHGGAMVDAIFAFVDGTFQGGQELMLTVSGLSSRTDAMQFLARWSNDAYIKASAREQF